MPRVLDPTSQRIQAEWSAFVNRCQDRRGGSRAELSRNWDEPEQQIRIWSNTDSDRERISIPMGERLWRLIEKMSEADCFDLAGILFAAKLNIGFIVNNALAVPENADALTGLSCVLGADLVINQMAQKFMDGIQDRGIGADSGDAIGAAGLTAIRNIQAAIQIKDRIARRRQVG